MLIRFTRRQVNSWRLTKHHLVQRARKEQMTSVVADICGVQAQVLSGAALTIWARVEGITAENVLEAIWKHRSLVKTWFMRGTLHLLTASDLPVYVAALRIILGDRGGKDWLRFYRPHSSNVETIVSGIRAALDERRLTREELADEVTKHVRPNPTLRKEMLSAWGTLLQPAAFQGQLCFGPSHGQKVTFVRPDQWLGKWDEPNDLEALKTLLRRFFSAYGPANHEALAHYWGIFPARARELMRLIAHELEEVDFEGNRTWMRKTDLEQAKTPETIHSVRLLPSWDCYVMLYHPREFLVPQSFRARIFRQLEGNAPVLLVDGVAAGVWERRKRGRRVEVKVEPFHTLSTVERRLVKEEATGLGEFLETDVEVSFSK